MNKSDSTNGVVLFSISLPRQHIGNYYIDIFHIESRKKEKLFINTLEIPTLKNDKIKIFYCAKVLPKGEYKIYGWGKIFNDGTIESGYASRGNFALPFTVFGGDVNYVGDYLGIFQRVTDGDGLKAPTKAYFVVSNRYQEDKGVIREKFTSLDLNHVVDAMPDFADNNPAYSGMYLKGINVP